VLVTNEDGIGIPIHILVNVVNVPIEVGVGIGIGIGVAVVLSKRFDSDSKVSIFSSNTCTTTASSLFSDWRGTISS
jgi:hypothetical protein